MTKITTGGHLDMKMVNSHAAAVDIGSTMHMAAVNPDTCETCFWHLHTGSTRSGDVVPILRRDECRNGIDRRLLDRARRHRHFLQPWLSIS